MADLSPTSFDVAVFAVRLHNLVQAEDFDAYNYLTRSLRERYGEDALKSILKRYSDEYEPEILEEEQTIEGKSAIDDLGRATLLAEAFIGRRDAMALGDLCDVLRRERILNEKEIRQLTARSGR